MNRWNIGDFSVTRIVELEVTGGSRFILPDATPQACLPIDWLQPHFMNAEGKLIMSIHALIVDTGSHRIMVDTCLGNDKERSIAAWNKLQGPFLDDIADAGYPRESIDYVLCTHLHVDHVGWNTMLVNGQWVPTFPNARYLIGRQEWAYWNAQSDTEYGPILDDSVRPVFDAGLVDLVEVDHTLCEGVSLESTPGHTPGHVSVHLSSHNEEALITGDCIHHPCQIARTEWGSSADYDQQAARQTREQLLDRYAERDTLIIGTHFATPTAGHLKRSDDGYWFDVLDPESSRLD